MQAFEVFIKTPTPFMVDHWPSLLPDWTDAPQSLVLILLRAQFSLDQTGIMIETEKERLLAEFFKLSEFFQEKILNHGDSNYGESKQDYLTAIISPKDGLPLNSSPGTLVFDTVAAVNYWLGFPFARTDQGCKVMTHPQWQQAVYPGLLLSAASPLALQSRLKKKLNRDIFPIQ
jgi:hypothetical protein